MNLPTPLVLTNDDGIDAPGIRALQRAVGGVGIFVAPREHHSGCSHLTTVNTPIPVERRSDAEFVVNGTPADSARLAVSCLVPEVKLVLAGINAGGNLGHDVYCSGTVAAAREAVFLGIPAIAISHYMRRDLLIDWDVAAVRARRALDVVLRVPLPPGTFWNINLPHLPADAAEPEIVFCSTCTEPLPMAYRETPEGYLYETGSYHTRRRTPDTDVDVCFGGRIAVAKLSL